MRTAGRIIIAVTLLLAPLFASGQMLIRWPAGSVLSEPQLTMFGGADNFFGIEKIDDDIFARIDGISFGRGCTTPRKELRLLHILHRNFAGQAQVGEMICNKAAADDLLAIFRELYDAGYPIEKVFLIDEYGGNDERSMSDNNTSCFNFRNKPGMTQLSQHALGLAVDINPLYNPYVKGAHIEPASAARYADRSRACKYYIKQGDICHQAFTRRGWRWGGSWRSSQDYQHFEKTK